MKQKRKRRSFIPLKNGEKILSGYQISINGARYRNVSKKIIGLIYDDKMFWPIRKPTTKKGVRFRMRRTIFQEGLL